MWVSPWIHRWMAIIGGGVMIYAALVGTTWWAVWLPAAALVGFSVAVAGIKERADKLNAREFDQIAAKLRADLHTRVERQLAEVGGEPVRPLAEWLLGLSAPERADVHAWLVKRPALKTVDLATIQKAPMDCRLVLAKLTEEQREHVARVVKGLD